MIDDQRVLVDLSPETIRILAVEIARAVTKQPRAPEKLVGIKELHDAIGVPTKTLYRWSCMRAQNKMPVYKQGIGVRFKVSEIQEWMRRSNPATKRAAKRKAVRPLPAIHPS